VQTLASRARERWENEGMNEINSDKMRCYKIRWNVLREWARLDGNAIAFLTFSSCFSQLFLCFFLKHVQLTTLKLIFFFFSLISSSLCSHFLTCELTTNKAHGRRHYFHCIPYIAVNSMAINDWRMCNIM